MDTSRLPPADAAVALRSLPRRFRAATALRADDETEDLLERPGPDGRSVVALAVDTVRSLSLLTRALDDVLVSEEPVLHPAVVERDRREFDVAVHGHLDDVLAELDDVAPELADRIDRVPADDWLRRGRVPGRNEPVTAIDLVHEAVSTAVDDLRATEATLHHLRHT